MKTSNENQQNAIAQLDSNGVKYTSKTRSIDLGLIRNSYTISNGFETAIITTSDVPVQNFEGCIEVITGSNKIYKF
jgi:hypothetical protein